ncbi:MAG: DUF4838 domain-containing protein [Actinobacteria bacterium]|nr:DUF4838 domain-containing protein [Actinomycetota bacterium]
MKFFAPDFDFYEGNAEHVPQRQTVSLAPLDITEEPSLTYRRKHVEEGWSHTSRNLPQLVDWMAKQRLNILVYPTDHFGRGGTVWADVREQLLPEIHKRDLLVEVGAHGFQTFLPPEDYPQYYPPGTVAGSNVFEVDNDEAVQAYVDNVVAYLQENPEIDIFDAWPPDGAIWPPSATEEFGSIANAYAHVVSELGTAIRQELPGVRVEAIAYDTHIEPPDPEYMYHTETIIDFAPYDRSYTETIDGDTYPLNRYYVDLIERWRDAFDGDLAIYEYYRKYSFHSLPVVMPELIGYEAPYYRSLGISGLGTYSEPADWMTYELTHLILADASWNEDLDVEQYLTAYTSERYGAAAEDMRTYFALVERAGRAIFDRAPGNYSDMTVVSAARDGFLAARAALDAGDSKVPSESTEGFLLRRLARNAEFAIADTEIRYYELTGESERAREAREATHVFVDAHRFDGIIVKDRWSMRSYQSGMTGNHGPGAGLVNTQWVWDMYRRIFAPAPPPGDSYLSDHEWRYGGNGWGPVERDQSNGSYEAGDGDTLSIDGQTFARGLGTHAYSEIAYQLDDTCERFTSWIGIDDEVRGSSQPFFGEPAPATFQDDWDFRDQQGKQAVAGGGDGTMAVLGHSEAEEPSDPEWLESPIADHSGQRPWVLSLDGNDDVVTLPGVDDVELSQGFAFEGWFYQRTRGNFPRLFERRPGMIFFVLADGRLRVDMNTVAGKRISAISQDALPLNEWAHVGLVYDVRDNEARGRLYLNGEEVSYAVQDVTSDDPALLGGRPTYLGNRGDDSDRGFDGLVAFARVVTPARALDEWTLDLFPLNALGGTVVFEVWGDDRQIYTSDIQTKFMPPTYVDVSVEDVNELRLIVLDGYDGKGDDHANWAEPRISC